MSIVNKLKSRSELQLTLLVLAVVVINRVAELGLSAQDLWLMLGGTGSYAVSRGMAKFEGLRPDTSEGTSRTGALEQEMMLSRIEGLEASRIDTMDAEEEGGE